MIPPHPLANFEIQKYYQNEPRLNEVDSRYNLLDKIKDRAYIVTSGEYSDTGTYWIALYALKNVTYFDSFGVEHISKEIIKCIDCFSITTNIYRPQAYDLVIFLYWICWFYA